MTTTTAAAPLAYSIRTATDATGLSKTHLIDAINRGELKARRSSKNKDGDPQGKWIVLASDLEAYLSSLPEG